MAEENTKKKSALIIGIDEYATQPLEVCGQDAKAIAAMISMPEYGFSHRIMLNGECTRRALMLALEHFFRDPADTYLIYFSGHGWATDLGVYLVAVDSDADEQGVDLEFLKRLITRLPPPNASVIVVLDCCHSGAATPRGFASSGVQVRTSDITAAIPALSNGKVVLAACRGDQLAFEDSSLGHGIFTFNLLEGMLGAAADDRGEITVTGLYDYAARAFSDLGRQTPVFRGDIAGRLVLGFGFLERTQVILTEDRALEIERDAELHLRDYQHRVAPAYADLDTWKAEGHKTACLMLEPILGWFAKQLQQYPYLGRRAKFGSLHKTAIPRLAQLCAMDAEMTTSYGQITSRLGSGTFGTVWMLPETTAGKPLAYKTYHAHDLVLPEKMRRFSHGYEAMRQMDHPHIVKVHQFTNCPLGFYMDYIDGPNLRDFHGTIDSPHDNVRYLRIIGETLKHAHIRGVKHRDVKPENILMRYDETTAEWSPFLTDFDLAWFSTASQIFTKEAMGSIYYASPEQFATPSSASAHAQTTDVFSFGQLAFYVATGSDPVPLGVADNIRALRNRLGAGWFSDAAERFVSLYEDCTKARPDARPQDFNVICDRLFLIEQSLSSIADSEKLTFDEFTKELTFAMVGLRDKGDQGGHSSFVSMSRKTRVHLEARKLVENRVSLELNFHLQDIPVLDGVTKFEQVRKTMYGRLDNVLEKYANTKKRHGTTAPFQVYVDADDVTLDLAGVAYTRALIGGVLDVIEGR